MVIEHNGFHYAARLNGLSPEFFKDDIESRILAYHKVRLFQASAQTHEVKTRRRSIPSAVRRWLLKNDPGQYFACWLANPAREDDSVTIWHGD